MRKLSLTMLPWGWPGGFNARPERSSTAAALPNGAKRHVGGPKAAHPRIGASGPNVASTATLRDGPDLGYESSHAGVGRGPKPTSTAQGGQLTSQLERLFLLRRGGFTI